MSMKNKNELNKEFSDYWSQKRQETSYYLRKWVKDRGIDDIEDILSGISVKIYEKLSTNKYPRKSWDALLRDIRNGCLIDFYRAEGIRCKRMAKIENEELEKIDNATEEKINKSGENSLEEKIIPFLRKILLTKHRSLQETMLIFQAPTFKAIREKIRNNFPFIINRVRQKGVNFEFTRKNEKSFTEDELKEMNSFSNLTFKLSNELKLNDWIGKESLKILLISDNPFFNLCLIGNYPKKKDYKSFNEKGKLIKKKTTKRPYSNFFRDYLAIRLSFRKIRGFVKDYAAKYPDYPVDEEYVKKWFGIKNLNSGSINKQRFGRTGKPGFKEKIKKYDAILRSNQSKL